jgi:hypothetical protein
MTWTRETAARQMEGAWLNGTQPLNNRADRMAFFGRHLQAAHDAERAQPWKGAETAAREMFDEYMHLTHAASRYDFFAGHLQAAHDADRPAASNMTTSHPNVNPLTDELERDGYLKNIDVSADRYVTGHHSPAASDGGVEAPPSSESIHEWIDNAYRPSAANIDKIARHCARPIRGCATDEQYTDVVGRVTAALTAARVPEMRALLERVLVLIENVNNGFWDGPDVEVENSADDVLDQIETETRALLASLDAADKEGK